MNERQKTYLLNQLTLARELGFEYLTGATGKNLAEVASRLNGAASPAPPVLAAGASSVPVVESPLSLPLEEKERLLAEMAASMANCVKCRLSEGRTQVVFGVGSANADVVFVGEAPGFHEDQQGEPFVGQAVQLLTKIILAQLWVRCSVDPLSCFCISNSFLHLLH